MAFYFWNHLHVLKMFSAKEDNFEFCKLLNFGEYLR